MKTPNMPVLWLNGALLEENRAALSVDDRGFRFGDGLFETIPIESGLPYLWDYHLGRLQQGLAALRIAYDAQALKPAALKLLRANGVTRGVLRLHVSRGVGSRGYMPSPSCTGPTVLMQVLEPPLPSGEPVALWLSRYEKISPRALPTHCKLAQGLNSILARMEAVEQGCQDALLCSSEGHIAEASSANIFWRQGEMLYTPALATGALAGVTRQRLMELSPYPVEEGRYIAGHLKNADALVLTNASMGITPVFSLKMIDGEWLTFRDSAALAGTLNNLRNNDISHYIRLEREALA